MDNDLIARRLRPPSQPNSRTSRQPADQSGQPSPWDFALSNEAQFAPPKPQTTPLDPPFAPQFGQAGPTPRADVPWDRPDPEPWPPTEPMWPTADAYPTTGDEPAAADGPVTAGPGDPLAASNHAATPDSAVPWRAEWPAADALGESAAPWDRPDGNAAADEWRDPDDALAPVVADVQSTATWAAWNGNTDDNRNGVQPPADDRLYSAGSSSLPEWPTDDDLTHTPTAPAWSPVEPPAMPQTPDWTDPTVDAGSPIAQDLQVADEPIVAEEPLLAEEPRMAQAAAEPFVAADEPDSEPEAGSQAATPPQPAGPRFEVRTPPNTQVVAVTPGGTPQNMVLRIELAIVDESHRPNPAESAKRVGPDADVRRPQFEPRETEGGSVPEPEYIWDVPPVAPNEAKEQPQQRAREVQPPAQPPYPPQPTQHVAPPPSAWLPPTPPTPPTQPTPPAGPVLPQTLDWELPEIMPRQPTVSTPAPAPTWAMTQPAPSPEPEPPQYVAPSTPSTPQYQKLTRPQYPQAAPLYQPPARDSVQYDSWQQTGQAAYPPAAQPAWPQSQQPFSRPTRPQQMPQPMPPAPTLRSAPAAGAGARPADMATDQSDLWFLNNQPTAAEAEGDAQPENKSRFWLTAVLTFVFAGVVIALVLLFIQLMTSVLR